MYPCIRPFCVAMTHTPMSPCMIHRQHPHFVPEQEPVAKVNHWEMEPQPPETSDPDFTPADSRL
jgi:hypothetical protein